MGQNCAVAPVAGARLSVGVTPRDAEALQTFLRRRGVGATLCWGPYGRACRLELWPGADPDRARAALAAWDARPGR
jgi:hypothetical protein